MTVEYESQKLDQDDKVRLLTIVYAGGTLRFTNYVRSDGSDVVVDGETYSGRKFNSPKFQVKAGGALPRPVLKIDNIDDLFWPLAVNNSYFVGATVNYKEMYRENLDDGSDPDPTQTLCDHNYVVRRMRTLHRQFIALELRVEIDVEKYLFGVQVMRNVCQRRYRVPDPNTADQFTQYSCPWGDATKRPGTGTPYFKKDGTSTSDWREDDCGQQYADCVRRFHNASDNVKLPFQGASSLGSR